MAKNISRKKDASNAKTFFIGFDLIFANLAALGEKIPGFYYG